LFAMITGVASPSQIVSPIQEAEQAVSNMSLSENAPIAPRNSDGFTLEDMFSLSPSQIAHIESESPKSPDQKSETIQQPPIMPTEPFSTPPRRTSVPKLLSKPITQPQRETKSKFHMLYTPEQQVKIYNSLFQARNTHREALDTKLVIQKSSQETHGKLWTFQEVSKLLEGMCGCGNRVSSPYPLRLAHFQDHVRVELEGMFQNLLQWTTQNVFTSLYQQTLAEIRLARLVQSIIHQMKSQPLSEAFNTLKQILRGIFDSKILVSSNNSRNSYATQTLKSLVCYL
jgi:hypothetical protein